MEPSDFLQRLGRYLSQTFTHSTREAPDGPKPMQTLTYGSGSCRDFTVLFMETARCLGLAAAIFTRRLPRPIMASLTPG